MKYRAVLIVAMSGFSAGGCGRVGVSEGHPKGNVDGGNSGGKGGASSGAGGATSGGSGGENGGAASACPSTVLSTAPLECLQDWTHAKMIYPETCQASRGGYQATCADYDAIVYSNGVSGIWCFYGTGTGNLSGSLVRKEDLADCKSFDLDFKAPDVSTCASVSGKECPPDAGP